MITKELVQEWLDAYLEGTDYEVAELRISAEREILVEVDRLRGIDVAFCGELNRYLADKLGDEDYSIEVGSVSLTDPFKTQLQYRKNIGREVKILTRDGKILHGQLVNVEDEMFQVDVEKMVQVEGKKRKQKQIETLTFGYDEVQYTKYELKV